MRCQILFYSNIHMAFTNSTLIFPESEALLGTNLDIQYFLVGDEMFPLKNWHQHPIKASFCNSRKWSIITVIRGPEES